MGQQFIFSFEQHRIIAKQRNSANVATISFLAFSALGAISYIIHYFSTHGCPGGPSTTQIQPPLLQWHIHMQMVNYTFKSNDNVTGKIRHIPEQFATVNSHLL